MGLGRRRAAIIWMAARLHRVGAGRLALDTARHHGRPVLLGIMTVISGIAITLAVAHQLVGALLFGLAVMGAHRLGQRERSDE